MSVLSAQRLRQAEDRLLPKQPVQRQESDEPKVPDFPVEGDLTELVERADFLLAAIADLVLLVNDIQAAVTLFGELLTLVQNRLPVKLIVFNNSSLNFVELEMSTGIVNFGTDLHNPDLAAVASAMGMFGRRVERPDDLPTALRDAFDHDGPH